jgi:hypothetical protein
METECASCEVRTGLYVLLQVASISQLTVSRLSRQYGIHNISQPCRPPRPVTGIALLLFIGTIFAVILLISILAKLPFKYGNNHYVHHQFFAELIFTHVIYVCEYEISGIFSSTESKFNVKLIWIIAEYY